MAATGAAAPARDEAVAAPRHGFDEARLARVVAERGAQVADGGLQHRFADELVAPHGVEQRVLRQQRTRLARQRAQQVEGRRRERDRPCRRAAAGHSPRRARTRRIARAPGSSGDGGRDMSASFGILRIVVLDSPGRGADFTPRARRSRRRDRWIGERPRPQAPRRDLLRLGGIDAERTQRRRRVCSAKSRSQSGASMQCAAPSTAPLTMFSASVIGMRAKRRWRMPSLRSRRTKSSRMPGARTSGQPSRTRKAATPDGRSPSATRASLRLALQCRPRIQLSLRRLRQSRLDTLSDGERHRYLYARAIVGRELTTPIVRRGEH